MSFKQIPPKFSLVIWYVIKLWDLHLNMKNSVGFNISCTAYICSKTKIITIGPISLLLAIQ